MATELAVRFDGHMGHVARLLGGELMAEQRDPLLIASHVGSKGFADIQRLMLVVSEGVPVSVGQGGDLDAALQNAIIIALPPPTDVVETTRRRTSLRSGSGAEKFEVREIKHLRVSPLAVVESKIKPGDTGFVIWCGW